MTGGAGLPSIVTTYPEPARTSRKSTLPAASIRRFATSVPAPSRRTAVAPRVAPVTATWFTLGWTWNVVVATVATAPVRAGGAKNVTTRSATPATGSRRRNTGQTLPAVLRVARSRDDRSGGDARHHHRWFEWHRS